MSNSFDIEGIIGHYKLKGEFRACEVIDNGHINNTFVLTFDDNGSPKQYILQQINTNVFRNPDALMDNYIGVTNQIRNKVREAGGNPKRESLRVYNTKDGEPFFKDADGRVWRVINFIINTDTYNLPDTPELCRKAGKTFGTFQQMLADYPIDALHETIPNFHNTVSRFADFHTAVEQNLSNRAEQVQKEIDFVLAREADCGVLLGLLEKGELPLRVTHNDTKLNNVLFDRKTQEGICVIDLDTVMPGLSLYDFGDSLRFAGNTAAEDEKNLDKVHFDMEVYRSYTEGYLSTAGKSLTEREVYYLPFSCKLMTLECGMRFLGDFLNGDTYFKTAYPTHNLDRCRTQFKLVEEIEAYYDEMMAITQEIYRNL
ncbi:MAG TPA: mucin desulfatase [Ruminococcaceae bacterium]|nr:mucin desulfatase [Oscillospiraceae bacterium]